MQEAGFRKICWPALSVEARKTNAFLHCCVDVCVVQHGEEGLKGGGGPGGPGAGFQQGGDPFEMFNM